MNDGRAPYTYQVGWALSEVYAELNIENEDAEQFYTDLGKYFRAVHNDKEKADYFAQKARAIRRKRLS